jgi:hypothetical protein
MDQSDIDLHEEEETGERAALAKARLGLLGPGDDAPNQALIVRERSPAFRDAGEIHADHDLSGRAGIKRDEGGVGVLAISVALPNCVPTFTGPRDVERLHDSSAGAATARSAGWPGGYAILPTTAFLENSATRAASQDSICDWAEPGCISHCPQGVRTPFDAGPRAVPGSQRVRRCGARARGLIVGSNWWPLRAGTSRGPRQRRWRQLQPHAPCRMLSRHAPRRARLRWLCAVGRLPGSPPRSWGARACMGLDQAPAVNSPSWQVLAGCTSCRAGPFASAGKS